MSNAIKELKRLHFKHWRSKYPAMDARYYAAPQYSPKKANGLTKCIIDYIVFRGGQAERISSEGRVKDNRQTVVDVIGRTKTIGSIERVYSSTTKGTADISATIAGLSVKIEIKIGKDQQSEAQKRYQTAIEKAGGFYVIAKDFETFVAWYKAKFESKEGGGYE